VREQHKSYTPFVSLFITFPLLISGVLFGLPYIVTDIARSQLVSFDILGITVSVADLFFTIGVFLSASLSFIIYFFLYARFKAEDIADTKTTELIKSRDFFLRLFFSRRSALYSILRQLTIDQTQELELLGV